MDTSKANAKHQQPPKLLTLADVCARVTDSNKVGAETRARLLSAVRTAGRLLSQAEGALVKLPLTAITADPDEIQSKLKAIKAGTAGMTVRHHTNMRSNVQRAIKIAGTVSARKSSIIPEWHSLRQQLPPHQCWRGLTVTLRRLSAKNVSPDTLTQADIAAAIDDEVAALPTIEARRIRNKIVSLWHSAHSKLPAWPLLEMNVERRERWAAMKWGDLPKLRSEVDAYLVKRSPEKSRALGALPKLRPKSAAKSRDHFRYIATDLIDSGIAPDLIDLAFIARPENVEIATMRMRERLGEDVSSGLANRIATIKAAARLLKLLDKSDLDLLETYRRNCTPEDSGQTDKNAARLDQFDDPRLRRRFIHLSDEFMREATAKRGTLAGARLAARGVAFELTLRTAARGGNISSLEYKRHFQKSGDGIKLRIPKGEVKNRRAIECRLGPKLIAMLDDYINHHHPVLAPEGSIWLFPNEADPTQQRPDGSLMNSVSREIRRRLQIDFSGHTFRQLVGKLLLGLDPSLAPLVRRVLGHGANSSATERYLSATDPRTYGKWDEAIEHAGHDVRHQVQRRPIKPGSATPNPL